MKYAYLDNRGLISVTGDDAQSFLQGIITNDVTHLTADKPLYACFLTPQGKYLADFFMYQQDDVILLDVDQALLQNLLKRMTMFKLRSKVVLEDVSEHYTIHAVWNTHVPPVIPNVHVFADPRGAMMGYRVLGTKETVLGAEHDMTKDDYRLWQIMHGVPNHDDFERERTAMLEANMDYLHALSWTKGCYMGQELTARTHYRGLIKKRFLPILLPNDMAVEPNTAITRDGKTIGFVRNCYKNYAMGLVQLDVLEAGRQCTINDIQAEIIIPEWFDSARHEA